MSCTTCEGTGSFTDIGEIALLHTPTYRAASDSGSPEAAHHVLNFFSHTGFAEPANVQFDSLARVDDTDTGTTFAFSYRFQLPAAQLSVQTRRYFFGDDDFTEWTVVGKNPEVIDYDLALFPLLLGASIPLQDEIRWKSQLRPGFNQRVSNELKAVLNPGVHRWIIEATTAQRSIEDIEIEIRRGLDPQSIAAVANNVTHALKATYRRRMVSRLLSHLMATLLITFLFLLFTSGALRSAGRGLFKAIPNDGAWRAGWNGIDAAAEYGARWIMLIALARASGVVASRHH